jgi:hypothetical protein
MRKVQTLILASFSVVLGCGSTIAENCTYFQSATSNQATGQCSVSICKCSSDICQVSDSSVIGYLVLLFLFNDKSSLISEITSGLWGSV